MRPHRWPSASSRRLVLLLLLAWCTLLVSAVTATTVPWPAETQVDLLEGLPLHNLSASLPGVSLAPGPPHTFRPAINLQGDFRELRLPQPVFSRVVDLLRNSPEFTLAVALRQDEANSGTILSFAHGYNRYLELQSSGRKDEVRLHYTHSGAVFIETFPFRLADGAWHRLAVWVSGAQVELLVDCQRLYRRVIRAPDRNFSATDTSQQPNTSAGSAESGGVGGDLALWLGQRNNKHSLFKGALHEVRVVAGPHGYLRQCPQLDSSCPTCGQFLLLESTVEQLTKQLHRLSQRLEVAEARQSKIEDCECQKSCRVNGSVHADGATWQRDCALCACVRGEVKCRPVQCPPISCKNPELAPGECCPSCLKQCYLKGVFYDHGEAVNLRQCVECLCHDGVLRCDRIDPNTMCPPLPCPPELQFSVPGVCCKFCPDLNECLEEGGLIGHHCRSNTRCLNTPGSYTCECLPGYKRVDRFNCVEHDECRSGEHTCHDHAQCLNTQGSYHCHCLPGYRGDGLDCRPECNQTCQNGGICIAPGECSCRRGFSGASCEQDVDECALGVAACHANSMCINMPGWYYCACRPGYRSATHDNSQGALCRDVDECSEGSQTCHPSAKCVNVEGSFECSCEGRGPECSLNCLYRGVEVVDGGQVHGPACQQCSCRAGRVTCEHPVCDCSMPGVRIECCPKCDKSSECRHQELHHVAFHSGERWIYQCQTCECLHGEVDCWPVECPPVSCSQPVLTPGDCCPRCEDDPCALQHALNDSIHTQGQPCSYAGRLVASGSEWRAAAASAYDKCTSCRCKDGQLCCSFADQCSGDNSGVSNDETSLGKLVGRLSGSSTISTSSSSETTTTAISTSSNTSRSTSSKTLASSTKKETSEKMDSVVMGSQKINITSPP